MKGMGDVPAWNDAREDVVDGDVVDDSDVLTYANWVELTVMLITCPYLLAGARQLMSKEMCGSNLQLDCVIFGNPLSASRKKTDRLTWQ